MTSVKYKRHEQWVIKSSPFVDRDVIRQAQTKRWVIKKGTPLGEMAQKTYAQLGSVDMKYCYLDVLR